MRAEPLPTPAEWPTGTLVVGVSGTAASRHALRSIAHNSPADHLILTTAIRRRRRSAKPAKWGDVLKQDAYLLSDESVIHETLRAIREEARRYGALEVTTWCVEGDPFTVLTRAVEQTGASGVVLGARNGQTRLTRRLSAATPTVVIPMNTTVPQPLSATTPRTDHPATRRLLRPALGLLTPFAGGHAQSAPA